MAVSSPSALPRTRSGSSPILPSPQLYSYLFSSGSSSPPQRGNTCLYDRCYRRTSLSESAPDIRVLESQDTPTPGGPALVSACSLSEGEHRDWNAEYSLVQSKHYRTGLSTSDRKKQTDELIELQLAFIASALAGGTAIIEQMCAITLYMYLLRKVLASC